MATNETMKTPETPVSRCYALAHRGIPPDQPRWYPLHLGATKALTGELSFTPVPTDSI